MQAVIINIFNELNKNMFREWKVGVLIKEYIRNFKINMESIKMNNIEVLKIKNTIIETKNN